MRSGLVALMVIVLASCVKSKEQKLPFFGIPEINETMIDGKVIIDTVPHTIPAFEFINQDSQIVTQKDFKGKIYLADFFFRTCKAICPTMKKQMLRVQEAYGNKKDFLMISHSLDPVKDEVPLLKSYAEGLGANLDVWHFITGNEEDIYRIAKTGYLVTALKNPEAPGGIDHSGHLILVDREGRIRGHYDGTDPIEVDRCIKEIGLLYNED